jgi:hypothetical protein
MLRKITTKINKESLTTKLTLVIIGLTAGSALLVPATYASFHPVTTGEIADGTIRSADISNTAGVQSVDIVNGQVGSVDIGQGQVARGDIQNDAIRPNIQIVVGPQVEVPTDGAREAFADCPAGTIITGGGYDSEIFEMRVVDSHPTNARQWIVTGFNEGGASDAVLEAYALCMGPMP